ncbi:protein cholesin [Salminus brasiliensis]|uniref:protein cholesin n=1 Tax=Salminus brasiliensis TaxID=930266 RepID=UPI003B82ECDB
MANSQPLQPEASSKKKEKKKAKPAAENCGKQNIRDKKKKKRTKDEEPEVCVPADDVAEVKKKKQKADTNVDTALKNKSSLAVAQLPAEAKTDGAVEGMDDLSPEEIRVLERKLKKIRRKEEKKRLKEEGKSKKEDSKTNVAQTQALEYLTCWSQDREKWKFQKTRQVWLLQHMYDSEKVSDDHFAVLLSYVEGLQGVARETTVQKAEALVRWDGQEGPEGGAAEAQKRAHRAKEIIQMLS